MPFWLAMVPRVFTSLTKPILFFSLHKGLHVVIYLDDILPLLTPNVLARELKISCAQLVCPGLCINSSKSEHPLTQQFSFGAQVGIQ